MNRTPLMIVLGQIATERRRQEDKWGPQSHPDGTGDQSQKDLAAQARESCDEKHSVGIGTWADILAEEFFEAMAESDPTKLREELVQVAAVATAWVEHIDRRVADV